MEEGYFDMIWKCLRKEGLERKREELNIIVLLLVDNYILYFCLSRAQVDSCRFWSVQ